MKKLFNLRLSLLAVGLTAVMFTSTAAFGSESYDDLVQAELNDSYDDDSEVYEGTYVHDYATGETKFVLGYNPVPQDPSDETFGFSPGYDPFSNETDLWSLGNRFIILCNLT